MIVEVEKNVLVDLPGLANTLTVAAAPSRDIASLERGLRAPESLHDDLPTMTTCRP